MKKHLLLGVAFGALAAATPAVAAPPAPVSTVFNWTGFYIGANAGYSWGDGSFSYNEAAFGGYGLPTNFLGSQSLNGGVGGFHGGYNYQAGSWLVGAETDFDWAGEKGGGGFGAPYSYQASFEGPTVNAGILGTVNAKIDWFGTVRARAGALVTPSTLFYGTAGFAYGRVGVSGSVTDTGCTPTTSCTWSFGSGQTKTGFAVGAGVEGLVPGFPRAMWRVEYLYVDLGTVRGSGFDTDFGGPYYWSQRVTDNILRAGISFKVP